MHIAASNPTYITKEEVDQAEIEHEKKILREQAMNEPKPKPAAIIEKMVEGRIEKYYKEVCLLEQPFVKDPDKTVGEMVSAAIAKIGEKISVRRFVRYGENTSVAYVHAGGKIGVLVNLAVEGGIDATEIGKDVAMQIAALNPRFWDKSEVTEEVLEQEKKIAMALMDQDPKNASKPAAIKEKIVMGKMNKFYQENCLLQQEFVKDGSMSVEKYIASAAKALGGSVKFVTAVRFAKGEGIEKKEEDFAAEVAAQMNMGKK